MENINFLIIKPDDVVRNHNFSIMQELREKNKLCDVTLKAGNKSFSVHSVVLAAAIPYFHYIFSNKMKRNCKEISVKEIEASTLENIINFAYGGEVRIDKDNVRNLMVGSSFLLLEKIREACIHFLTSIFNPENVLEIKYFADSINCKSLATAADAYISCNLSEVAKSEGFLSLDLKNFTDLLGNKDLKVANQEIVFEACMDWVYHSKEVRAPLLPKIMEYVRLSSFSPKFLCTRVGRESLIKASHQCRELLEEAYCFHLAPVYGFQMTCLSLRGKDNTESIYVIGGDYRTWMNTVEVYDPFLNEWKFREEMPTKKSSFSVAVLEGKLYIFGGLYNRILTSVDVYDPQANQWFQAQDMFAGICNAGVAVLNNCAYLCGGQGDRNYFDTAVCYYPKFDAWRKVGSKINCRTELCVVTLDGYLYAIGGRDKDSNCLDIVERCDPVTNVWTKVKSMLTKRKNIGAAPLNGKIYVCGGIDSDNECLRTVEIYDPGTDEWELGTQMNCKRFGHALTACLGKVYAIGGSGGLWTNLSFSSVEVYDPDEDTWSFVQSMNKARTSCGVGVLPN